MEKRHRCVVCKTEFGYTWSNLWDHYDNEGERCYLTVKTYLESQDLWFNVNQSYDSYVEYFVYDLSTPNIVLNYQKVLV